MNIAAKNYREVIVKSYEGAVRAASNNTQRNSVQSINKKTKVTAGEQIREEPQTGTLNFRKINDLLYKSSHPNRVEPGVIDLSSSSGQGFINDPPPKGNLKLN